MTIPDNGDRQRHRVVTRAGVADELGRQIMNVPRHPHPGGPSESQQTAQSFRLSCLNEQHHVSITGRRRHDARAAGAETVALDEPRPKQRVVGHHRGSHKVEFQCRRRSRSPGFQWRPRCLYRSTANKNVTVSASRRPRRGRRGLRNGRIQHDLPGGRLARPCANSSRQRRQQHHTGSCGSACALPRVGTDPAARRQPDGLIQ